MGTDWNVIGNQWAVELLSGQINSDRLRHAYLFLGPSGIGKFDFALAFAKAFNCMRPPKAGTFCGDCRVCRQFDRTQHPDLFSLQRKEGDKDIKVKAMRSLLRSLSLAPYDAEFRVALISDIQYASISASNALLKTLEEPPAKVIFLLTAEIPESLPATIVSRCELVRLRTVEVDSLAEELISRGAAKDQAQLLAHISGGRPGYAMKLRSDPTLLNQRTEWLDNQYTLLNATRRARFDFAHTLSKDKSIFRQVLLTWISFWHDVLLKSANANATLENLDRESQVSELADRLNLRGVHHFISALQNTLTSLDTNINLRLAAEALMLKMPY
ncbi:MAG: DNA polymerase III subunit delta' [Chloroflexi bacterium]|nr:DNA polymerase III subunit delta' [Chloroflexota bacterium]